MKKVLKVVGFVVAILGVFAAIYKFLERLVIKKANEI